jgi:Cof subfamily protein (haloacid dehalogenase superfamily)
MSVKIICFDLDGTFLDDQKNIPPENLQALEEAHRRGVFIVPATGRIYKGIPEPLSAADFARYFITANGAYVYDAKEDSAPVRAEISAERAVEFFTYVDGLNVLYDCYQDNWGYMTADMLSLAAETIPDPGIRRLIMGLRTPVPELKEYLREKGMDVQKLQLYFTDMQQRARELRELPERFPDLRFSTSVPFNIEINAAASTKGQAMCSLCKLLGIDPKDAMALGDGTNDLDMIQMAGTGVAMANADPAVLQAADVVTGNNNAGGFAKAVESFAL